MLEQSIILKTNMSDIKINNQFIVSSQPNESILDAILRSNYSHNYSCLNGRCNSCKARILKGKTIKLNQEIGLSKEEIESNYILTCSRKADGNIDINTDHFYDTPPLKVQLMPSKIFSIRNFNKQIIELSLKVPNRLDFNFMPGQYVNLKYNNIERSYSILSYDSHNNILSILCKKIEGGLFSQYLFEYAKENDRILVNGPLGMINIFRDTSKNFIFLATGVGIAPIKCMLNSDVVKAKIINKKISIFWGNRYHENFIYDFNQEKKNFDIDMFYCLSKKNGNFDHYNYGYIQDIMFEKNIPLSDTIIYACGSNNMINETMSLCKSKGFDMNLFFSDSFLDTSSQQ